jgi:hypothetical protein
MLNSHWRPLDLHDKKLNVPLSAPHFLILLLPQVGHFLKAPTTLISLLFAHANAKRPFGSGIGRPKSFAVSIHS